MLQTHNRYGHFVIATPSIDRAYVYICVALQVGQPAPPPTTFITAFIVTAVGYFCLDLVALVVPPDSPLDFGQSVPLVMTMVLFKLMLPMTSRQHQQACVLVCVIVGGSTVLDVVDLAFHADPNRILTIAAPAIDLVLSVFFLLWMTAQLCIYSRRVGGGVAQV